MCICSSSLYQQPSLTPRRPDFDSPSVFCRLLDKDKGGYFSISPPQDMTFTTKQQYLPSSNILQTRYIHEDGVVDLVDFFPRPKNTSVVTKAPKQMPFREAVMVQDELKKWLVRRVECIRGEVDLGRPAPCYTKFRRLTDIAPRGRGLPSFRLRSGGT